MRQMMQPSPYAVTPTVVDSLYSRCAGGSWGWPSGNVGSATWPSANRVLYCPFYLPGPTTIVKLWLYLGSATGTGNVDIGIYLPSFGTPLLTTGATSTSGMTVSAPNLIDVTDTTLGPGQYYLAMLATATSITTSRITLGGAGRAKTNRWLESTSSGTLPTSPTPTAVSADYFPHFGLTQHASLPL